MDMQTMEENYEIIGEPRVVFSNITNTEFYGTPIKKPSGDQTMFGFDIDHAYDSKNLGSLTYAWYYYNKVTDEYFLSGGDGKRPAVQAKDGSLTLWKIDGEFVPGQVLELRSLTNWVMKIFLVSDATYNCVFTSPNEGYLNFTFRSNLRGVFDGFLLSNVLETLADSKYQTPAVSSQRIFNNIKCLGNCSNVRWYRMFKDQTIDYFLSQGKCYQTISTDNYHKIRTTYANGKLHSIDDNPSREKKLSGITEWHKNGKLHRDGNQPAYIDTKKDIQIWYNNGIIQKKQIKGKMYIPEIEFVDYDREGRIPSKSDDQKAFSHPDLGLVIPKQKWKQVQEMRNIPISIKIKFLLG